MDPVVTNAVELLRDESDVLANSLSMNVATITAVPADSAPSRTQTGYRADIDGLRGIAVLAVVATHVGIPGFGGGFLGVDIFFVISGYLITRNLESARQPGWRGMAAFYGRRMRRTLPALYLVVAVTLLMGLLLLLPSELIEFARSLIGTLLFVPNIWFLNQAGYFDHAAITKPLLHTWSLGVEEQFYLLAPLLPAALRRTGLVWRRFLLLGLFGLALAFCAALHWVAPEPAFYLMPARLWEFLAGSLVAERVIPSFRTRPQAEIVAGLALIVLLASIGLFSNDTPHPSLPTVLPCLATAALIHVGGGHPTVAGRCLGNRALAGVGLISYSVYLWHWPLLVFARLDGVSPSLAGLVAAGAGLIGLSYLSWRFVEVPFRAPDSVLRQNAGRILPATATGLAVVSLILIFGHGLPKRFPDKVATLASYDDYVDRRQFREGSCFITSKYGSAASFDRATCLSMATDRPNYLLMGDSHGAHLWIGLKTIFPNANVMQATASGCKPLLDPGGKRYCADIMREVMQGFLPRHRVDVILLSASWIYDDTDRIAETVATLQRYARKVIVVGPIPIYSGPLPTLLARSILQGDDRVLTESQGAHVFELDQTFKETLPASEYVSLVDAICPGGKCLVYAEPGVPLQFDESHLTTEGSDFVARYIRQTALREEALDNKTPARK